MGTLTPTYRQLSLAVKYSSVLFPFETLPFVKAIRQQGSFVTEGVMERPVPFGARLEVSGTIGRKGEISVRVEADKQILAVQAPDTNSLTTEMDSIESLLKKEFDFDSSALAHYYEFLASLTLKAKGNPLERWPVHFKAVPILKKASKVLGMEVSPFGVRLAPRGELPNQPDWFEIRIEPLVRAPTYHHDVEVIFRHSRRNEVFSFVRKFEDILGSLMSLVEEE